MYNSLVIKESDTVVTVIAPIKAGEELIYNINGEEKNLTASTDIPIYHKAALRDIKKGEVITKYGCKIGYALTDIKQGEHIHTWNIDSMMK